MNWKIERDPYLRAVGARHGEAAVMEAGFFFDDDVDDAPLDDVDWLCTPTALVCRNLRAARDRKARDRGHATRGEAAARDATNQDHAGPLAVLLSTGGFHPVHDGHLSMMAAAREAVEEDGRVVIGGYLSPGHDDYIRHKRATSEPGTSYRITHLASALARSPQSSWLSVDPWEALACRGAVNFTDVTARLERYLRAHVDPAIDVIFVCGGDNARFALAFSEAGRCVVVGRPGHAATVAAWRADPRLSANDRIRWVAGDDPSASSDLPPVGATAEKRRLRLRLEDARAVAHLGLGEPVWRAFQAELMRLLARHLEVEAISLDPRPVAVRLVDDDGNSRTVSLVPVIDVNGCHQVEAEHEHLRTISLDPFVPGDVDLAVSRLFDLGGYQALGHVTRPGSAPIVEQVAAIAPGRWRLRDDDRATGSTIAFVRSQLPPDVTIDVLVFDTDTDHRFAHGHSPDCDCDCDCDCGTNTDGDSGTDIGTHTGRGSDDGFGDESEIADSRDFLVGTDHGGLVVVLPDGSVGRAPYVLPYVDPAARGAVPAGEALAFSRAVWMLNAEVFASTSLCVADLPPTTARTLRCAGHDDDTMLADACRWHVATLDRILGGSTATHSRPAGHDHPMSVE